MKYRMSEGLTNIGTPLKEAMERAPKPNTPLGLPLFWDAPAPRPDGSLINEGTKDREPVAWRAWFDADNSAKWLFTLWPEEEHPSFDWQPLYTTPPQRKPLTKSQVLDLWEQTYVQRGSTGIEFARAIEAAHGIKE